MIDLATLQIVRDFVAIFGVIAGFSYYVIIVRNSQRMQKQTLETRQAQLFMQVYNRWADRDITKMEWELQEWEDYNDYFKKYESNLDAQSLRSTVGKYYEGIGVLVKRGLIDPTLVDDLMSVAIIMYWRKIGPLVKEARERSGYPQIFEYQEYLYEQIMEIAKSQHLELGN